jgi:hypothetical protein
LRDSYVQICFLPINCSNLRIILNIGKPIPFFDEFCFLGKLLIYRLLIRSSAFEERSIGLDGRKRISDDVG